MYTKSEIQSPFRYIRRKHGVRKASKPTAVDKITNRPYINPQITSPLFALLPAEIRRQIFQFTLLSYPDESRPYSRHTYWYRPGYTHARVITTSLLLTCRRIYLETDLLPLTQNEHVFWGVERSRIPPYTSSYLLDGTMRLSQRNAIQRVHLFTQQYWLEDWKNQWLAFSQSWPDGCPPNLKITIRHTDWWYNLLGENSPLALDPKRKGRAKGVDWVPEAEPFQAGSWGQRLENMKGLRQLELELETVEAKRAELDVIIGRAHTWKFLLGDGRVLVLDEGATRKDTWTGSRHFKGLNATSVPAGLQLRQRSTASFASFSKRRVNSDPEILRPEDTLDYYVVTLTWRACDMPRRTNVEKADDTNNASTIPHTRPASTPVTIIPRVSYNRLNAVPTAYG